MNQIRLEIKKILAMEANSLMFVRHRIIPV